ncbi:MAG: YlxR family protein [Vampirovibrionales bacterium]|nr:YlxR family protein [Vampirovibrionales bacterium]
MKNPAAQNTSPGDPLRLCVHCRTLYPRQQLIRLVRSTLTAANVNEPEVFLLLPTSLEKALQPQAAGRSTYVCHKSACLAGAIKSRKLQKSLKCPIPGDIVMVLTKELEGLKSGDSTEI